MRLRNVLAVAVSVPLAVTAWAVGSAHATTLKADGCALGVSIAQPKAGQRETLTVKSGVAKTRVQVVIRYKTTSHTWTFTTASNREAIYQFGVGRPTPGYKVSLSGKVTAAPNGYRAGAACSTSFIPR